MARTRKISESSAVDAAVGAFWRHGYGALGTRQLEAETGITRFTLQTAYGGKMALFAKALDRYLDRMETELLPVMADGTLEGLARWFEMRSRADAMPKGAENGCMMIAAMNEFGGTEEMVRTRSMRFEKMLRTAFRDSLDQIAAAGGVGPTFDRESAVEVLVAASIGLNVVVRGAGACGAGEKMATGIAALIRGWGPPKQ